MTCIVTEINFQVLNICNSARNGIHNNDMRQLQKCPSMDAMAQTIARGNVHSRSVAVNQPAPEWSAWHGPALTCKWHITAHSKDGCCLPARATWRNQSTD